MVSKITILLITANLIIPLAIAFFAKGFFPYKPFLPGQNRFNAEEERDMPDPPFDKVILMVVDALRRFVSRIIGY